MDCKHCGQKHCKTLCYEALEKKIVKLEKERAGSPIFKCACISRITGECDCYKAGLKEGHWRGKQVGQEEARTGKCFCIKYLDGTCMCEQPERIVRLEKEIAELQDERQFLSGQCNAQRKENTRLCEALEKILALECPEEKCAKEIAKQALENRGLKNGKLDVDTGRPSSVQHRAVSPARHAPKKRVKP
jgi:hypothetical protein